MFLDWCERHGHLETAQPFRETARRLLRSHPATYGKVQGRTPPRFLSREDAYLRLVAACQDGTDVGLRDELAIRLGLLGMRRSELTGLTVANVAGRPSIRWTGKGNRPRQATAGSALLAVLERYLDRYAELLGHEPPGDHPLLARTQRGGKGPARSLSPDGRPIANSNTVYRIVEARARKAGLGHVAPHDLRRSAATILHHAMSEDGGHRFDLLDIQKVLGHSDPAITMRCYLEPLQTEVLDRAAQFLD